LVNRSLTPSISNSFWYWRTSAFLGFGEDVDQRGPRPARAAARSRQPADELRIMPYLSRSSGCTFAQQVPHPAFLLGLDLRPKPICRWPMRCSMMSSNRRTRPPQMNRMFVVSTCRKLLLRVLASALGGTLAIVTFR
jgi:hypothetical protein